MYKIIIKKKAKKFIDKLPMPTKKRIIEAINLLPYGSDIKQMKGHDDLFRLRVGDYRIIYTVQETGDKYIINIENTKIVLSVTGRFFALMVYRFY